MTRLSELRAPAVAGVVREATQRAAIAEIKNCVYDGADMIDLHLSCLEATDIETLREIIDASSVPVLALNYSNTYLWEQKKYTEEQRVELFLRALDAGAQGIDMQGYTFDPKSKGGFYGDNQYAFTKNSPKEVVTDPDVIEKQCELIETVHQKGKEVLLSCHPGIVMDAAQVVELALFLEKRNPDIIKIVTIAENEDDLSECIRAMTWLKKEVRTKVSYHAAGKAGALSRVVNPMMGGQIAFCVDRFSASSTMEQLDLKTVRAMLDGARRIEKAATVITRTK